MSIFILFLLLLINFKEYKNVLLRGERARNGEFPWLIQFQTVIPCGGVLLSSDWVLTAAQCVQDKRNSIVLLATGLNGTGSIQTISVKAAYIYPQYDAYSVYPDRDYNIALLKLIQPFDMCTAKVKLPNVMPVKYDSNYKSCLIFGWQSYVSPSSKVLAKPIQYKEVILNSWKLCTYMMKVNANYTNVFCTMVEFKDDMKACAGNPGSPVICENQYRESAILGIASWTNFSLECELLPTYIDLDEFRVWIYNIIFNNKMKQDHNRESNGGCSQFKAMDDVREFTQNNSNLLQTNDWLEDRKMELKNVSTIKIHENTSTAHFSNTLYLPFYNNFNNTSISPSIDYHKMLYSDAIKEPSSSIYMYEEIGNIKSSENQNEVTSTLDKTKIIKNLNESLLCNSEKLDKTTVKHNKEEIQLDDDDIEFLLPFHFDEAYTSYSNIKIKYFKNYCIFYFTILYILYVMIYI